MLKCLLKAGTCDPIKTRSSSDRDGLVRRFEFFFLSFFFIQAKSRQDFEAELTTIHWPNDSELFRIFAECASC